MFFCEPTKYCEHKAPKILRTEGESRSMFCECIGGGRRCALSRNPPPAVVFFKAYRAYLHLPPLPAGTAHPHLKHLHLQLKPQKKNNSQNKKIPKYFRTHSIIHGSFETKRMAIGHEVKGLLHTRCGDHVGTILCEEGTQQNYSISMYIVYLYMATISCHNLHNPSKTQACQLRLSLACLLERSDDEIFHVSWKMVWSVQNSANLYHWWTFQSYNLFTLYNIYICVFIYYIYIYCFFQL